MVNIVIVYLVRNVFGPVGVDEGIPRLVSVLVRWRNVGNHDSAAVAGQGVLEESGQLRVAVVNEFALALGQRVDAVPQGEQRAVYVGALFQPLAPILHSGRRSDSDRTLFGT